MKRFKLVLVASAFVLAAWLSGGRSAQAALICDNYAETPCSHLGFRFGCTWADGSAGICFCDGFFWGCA